jgi:hypothetical protein
MSGLTSILGYDTPFVTRFIRYPSIVEITTLIIAYLSFKILKHFAWGWYTSPLRELRFPPGGKGFLGHWPDMMRCVVLFLLSPPNLRTMLTTSLATPMAQN